MVPFNDRLALTYERASFCIALVTIPKLLLPVRFHMPYHQQQPHDVLKALRAPPCPDVLAPPHYLRSQL